MSDHLTLAGADADAQLQAAYDIIESAPPLMAALNTLKRAALPDAWLVSGALYGNIWNALTGRPWDHGVKDYDIFYFDASDLSYEAEDALIQRWTPEFAADPPAEIRNQARVPLWYEQHFGRTYPALSSSTEAIDRFACVTHCIGARENDGLKIYAPYGLDEIFSFRLTPNPILDNRETHEAKAKRQTACWPELTVIPWPDP
ncbi:MAG: nucleotidyltransferase family protein [Pseudomonadota bacterium]